MNEHTANTPHALAEMLDITPVTLRRWCEYHVAHLSPGANPLPGKARRFTGRDTEVLRHVRSLRDLGLTASDINEQLAGLTFAVIDTEETPDAPEPLDLAPAPLVQQSIDHTVLERLVRLETVVEQSRHNRVSDIVLGVLLALGFMIIILLLASIYGR